MKTIATTGLYRDVPFADYLAHPGYGSSDLRAFRVGPPAMVPWRRAHRNEGTDATRIGSAAHCMILTPSLFDASFWRKPIGMEFRSAENRKIRDEVLAAGQQILDHEEMAQVAGVAEAFARKRAARESLAESGEWRETSVYWTDPVTGLLCKGRPDWFTAAESLPYKAHANGWLNQLAHNRAGLAANGHPVKVGRLVIVSPNQPHSCWMLEVRENDMDHLDLDNEIARRGIAKCVASGVWPGTPEEWKQIELPATAVFVEDNDLEAAEEVL
jgi:hypothetical protein